MKFLNYLFIITLIGASGCSSIDESLRERATQVVLPQTSQKDISYGNSTQQTYDLYLPEGRNESITKTIIVIHGGSWIGGDKADLNSMINGLQKTFPDHAIVNMNYRLANESTIKAFPNQLVDIQSVLKDLQTKKKDLKINGDFALLGFSSGAHIATLFAATKNDNKQVKAVVNIVGPVDFTDAYYRDNKGFQTFLENLIDRTAYKSDMDLPAVLSPAQQITSATPPIINFYGNADKLVGLSQLESLEENLRLNSVPFESTIYDGGHANWSKEQYADLLAKTKAFLSLHF